MRFVLLLIVAIGWLLYFGSWFRARTENRRSNSIHSFSKHLSVLANTAPVQSSGARTGGASVIPLRPALPAFGPRLTSSLPSGMNPVAATNLTISQVRRRRRDILTGLGAATLLSALLAVVVGGQSLILFVVCLVALAAYTTLLLRAQRIGNERQTKVRYFPQASMQSDPSQVFLLQRSAN